ncbi:hypothetical protein Ga0466249_001241 [Sporomusaceae bacterium BoRhaA]|uniref:hypothetical protein n=1 Tax=Pelorhabdus rhamnosifermentans TaxID=2772457 RepID=UPI001C063677|nr:hypothetical protein [Pelorhabdus rhamnosifermentans]MBU2700149.1 hypothetical protein [Pelorhabdus rhamnosifermentans]
MPILKGIERVFNYQANTIISPPFPINLPAASTVSLATLAIPVHHAAYLVRAVINWGATFTPLATPIVLTAPGFAQVQFQILRDGTPIEIVTQTAGQTGALIGIGTFATAVSTYEIAAMQILGTDSLCSCVGNSCSTFELRATNITLQAPLSTAAAVAGTTTAAVGLVSLTIEEIEPCRTESDKA